MSFHFYLYRAAPSLPPINKWEKMQAEPLGNVQEIKQQLSALYPELRWKQSGKVSMGERPEPLTQDLDILVHEEATGRCHFITCNKASPSVMRRVLEAFKLNYVCAPEAGEMVDVYAYTDEDRYYVKKEWLPA